MAQFTTRAGAGVGYSLFLFGDMRDAFRNDASYQLTVSRNFAGGGESPKGVTTHVELASYVTDDVRVSSSLRLIQLAFSYFLTLLDGKRVFASLSVGPELFYYRVRNELHRDYPSEDRGFLAGAVLAIDLALKIRPTLWLSPFIAFHVPELNLRNLYPNVGVKFERIF